MKVTPCSRSPILWLADGLALAAAAYAAYAGITWSRYGRGKRGASPEDADPLLDRFMPAYDVVERPHVRVAAPAEITFSAAVDMDLLQSAIVRGIFKARELILGGRREVRILPRGLLDQSKALGWGVLAERPGHEIVFGGVTRPWVANTVFRAVPPEKFAAFDEPGYVKIAWAIRADPIGAVASVVRTETRVTTTDPGARAKFRWYWSAFSPGVALIRRIGLRLVKTHAERRAREASAERRTADALGSAFR